MPGPHSRAYSKLDQIGHTRRARKQARVTARTAAQRTCYAKVDQRERLRCRVTGVRLDPRAVSLLQRGEHHHIRPRSLGGTHTSDNVVLVSQKIHEAITLGKLRLSGHADEPEGLTVERFTPHGWVFWKVC